MVEASLPPIFHRPETLGSAFLGQDRFEGSGKRGSRPRGAREGTAMPELSGEAQTCRESHRAHPIQTSALSPSQ